MPNLAWSPDPTARIAAMAYSFATLIDRREIDTIGIAALLRALDVTAIELMDRYLPAGRDGEIAEALARAGTQVVAFDASCDFVTPDATARRAEAERAKGLLARAARFGARQALLVPGAMKPGMAPAEARRHAIDGLQRCVDEAVRLAITPSIENLGYQAALCGRSEHIVEICDAVGTALKVTFDAGNFLFANESPLAALARLAGRVSHVHLKDWVRGNAATELTGAALGDGCVDLAGVLAELARSGYTGWLSIEYEGPADPRAAVRRGIAFLRAAAR